MTDVAALGPCGSGGASSLGWVPGHLRCFAAIAAIFAVLFAPGAPKASVPTDLDLSGVVLAPTFETSELIAGRHEDGLSVAGCEAPPESEGAIVVPEPIGGIGDAVAEVRGRREADALRRGTPRRRGPPRF